MSKFDVKSFFKLECLIMMIFPEFKIVCNNTTYIVQCKIGFNRLNCLFFIINLQN